MKPPRLHPGSGLESYQHNPSGIAHAPTAQIWTDASFKQGAMGLGVALLANGANHPTTWTVRCKDAGVDSTQAELHALHFAVKRAAFLGHTSIVLHTDAAMAIWHVASNTSTYAVMPALQEHLNRMDCVQLQWVARERNQAANALSRMALSLPHSYAAGMSLKKSPPEHVPEWCPSV